MTSRLQCFIQLRTRSCSQLFQHLFSTHQVTAFYIHIALCPVYNQTNFNGKSFGCCSEVGACPGLCQAVGKSHHLDSTAARAWQSQNKCLNWAKGYWQHAIDKEFIRLHLTLHYLSTYLTVSTIRTEELNKHWGAKQHKHYFDGNTDDNHNYFEA